VYQKYTFLCEPVTVTIGLIPIGSHNFLLIITTRIIWIHPILLLWILLEFESVSCTPFWNLLFLPLRTYLQIFSVEPLVKSPICEAVYKCVLHGILHLSFYRWYPLFVWSSNHIGLRTSLVLSLVSFFVGLVGVCQFLADSNHILTRVNTSVVLNVNWLCFFSFISFMILKLHQKNTSSFCYWKQAVLNYRRVYNLLYTTQFLLKRNDVYNLFHQ